jgi:Zn-dependent protease
LVIKALLLLLTVGKFGKVLLSAGTMVISVFAYSLIFGWRYATGFVALILVHELGHYVAARQRGLDVGLPTFIPFMGAWIQLKDQHLTPETEAYVGIAGPMLGSLAAFACYLAYLNTGDKLFMALAYAGFMLNLFNLIPLSPLDGGRIVSVISQRIWLIGAPILVALFFLQPSPVLILILIMAFPGLITVIRNRGTPNDFAPQAPVNIRIGYGVQYLILLIFLSLMSFDLSEQLQRAL